jgi:nitrogen fixation protein FixH
MSASQRYTGLSFAVLAGALTISNDMTEISFDDKVRTEERTAGNDTDASYNATINEGKVTMKLFDTAEFGTALQTALRPGATFNLYIYSKGNSTGKPVVAFPALVTDYKYPIKFDKNVEIEIQLVKNGAFISNFGALA